MDLKKAEGRAVVKALADRADILVENFRPGVMEGWGLGPKVNPRMRFAYSQITKCELTVQSSNNFQLSLARSLY